MEKPHCGSPVVIAQWLERRALGREVVGSNLPAVSEVTLSGHPSGSLTIPRGKIGSRPRPGNSELTPRIIMSKREQNAGDDGFTLALKVMGQSQPKSKTESTSGPTKW